MPKVSVIIPCYNQGHYLRGALASVLAQTFDAWEAIVVDDGSIDDTGAVATSFADPRIRYIYQENQGLCAARNTGIRLARGEYLSFLDADDEWGPAFLARCVGVLERDSSLGFVYTRHRIMDAMGIDLPRVGGEVVTPGRFRHRIVEGGFFSCNAVLLCRDALQNVGDFDTDLTSLEDWDLWLRISRHYSARGIAEPLVRYRVYPGSMSTDAGRMYANRIAVVAKHFGPSEGVVADWPDEKRRAYAYAYSDTAISYIAQGNTTQGWEFLDHATTMLPQLLGRVDIYYELACGDQERRVRGTATLLSLPDAEKRTLDWLAHLDTEYHAPFASFTGTAYGSAYLALVMLSNQAGQSRETRRYLRNALRANPRLVANRYVVFQLAKQGLGWTPLWRWVRSMASRGRMGEPGFEA
jgi:glycosyltransferase involved in cell wall biosynthesis